MDNTEADEARQQSPSNEADLSRRRRCKAPSIDAPDAQSCAPSQVIHDTSAFRIADSEQIQQRRRRRRGTSSIEPSSDNSGVSRNLTQTGEDDAAHESDLNNCSSSCGGTCAGEFVANASGCENATRTRRVRSEARSSPNAPNGLSASTASATPVADSAIVPRTSLLSSASSPSACGRTPSTRTRVSRASFVPGAMPERLLDEELRLLSPPLEKQYDKSDLCKSRRPQGLLLEPPAPLLTATADRYVEVAHSRRFRRLGAAGAAKASQQEDRPSSSTHQPSGASQARSASAWPSHREAATLLLVKFLVLSFILYSSQAMLHLFASATHGTVLLSSRQDAVESEAMLSGFATMQAFLAPGRGAEDLALPLAYAPLAMPFQVTAQLLCSLAFIGACDQAVSMPAESRARSLAATWLYGAALLSTAFQMPTDVALTLGLEDREDFLIRRLEQAGSSPAAFLQRPMVIDATTSALQLEDSDALVSMQLSATSLDFWKFVIVLRAVFVLLAWALLCIDRGSLQFGTPALAEAQMSSA